MIAPEIGTTNDGPMSVIADVPAGNPVVVTSNEKVPLISKQRLFTRLSNALGMRRGQTFTSSAGGYVEFGATDMESGRTLGTFAGVFSPVALSMFSALLFLRVGFIVGNAGLWTSLLQFVIAYGILVFTVSSVCAVSTNGAVEGGGAYFMISRTLGPEFGGSIGTLFFLANIVSSALYITGCTEGIVENFGPTGYLLRSLPDGEWWRFLYCSVLNTMSLIVCLIGAGMFAKTSVLVLAVVCISLLSVIISFLIQPEMEVAIPEANKLIFQNETYHEFRNYTGLSMETFRDNWNPHYGRDYSSDGKMVNFAAVFGVLFSGVTGIMAGANMSGELQDPARNIPRGTLSAVAFTFMCYIVVACLTAATSTHELLQNNFIFMMPVNVWPPFVTIGILTATFSASLSNLIGSSRVLEALAKDNVFGSLLQFVVNGTWQGNPVAAVLISWLLVQLIMLIGSLNTIAQINSVLFLLSYLATNLACLGLELASAPNFRPSFRYFTWHTAFIGLVGTLIMMFLINTVYASISIVLCLILVIILHLFSPSREAHWGSISQALIFHQVRKYLLMLDSRKDHVKFWRPQMLLMVGNPRSACPLISFVNDLKKGGLYVLGHVKVGNLADMSVDPTLEEYTHWLTLVDHLKVKAFIELTIAHSVREGLQHMIRMSGLGAMKPNTIVLGFFDEEQPNDFFESGESQYNTLAFSNVQTSDGSALFALRTSANERVVNSVEYVGMVADTLKLKKNVCLCRHFHSLNKSLIAKSTHLKFVDVWPVNFFHPKNDDSFDTTGLFMLQLACIINMVPGWKKLQLRVFLCESHPNIENENASACEGMLHSNFHRLQQQLQMLRIGAKIFKVPGWSQKITALQGSSVMKDDLESNADRVYLLGVNQMLREHSEETAATFLYLPAPPQGDNVTLLYPRYLQLLTELTADLPPTILVQGVNAVTLTTL